MWYVRHMHVRYIYSKKTMLIPLSANSTKGPNTHKQFVRKLPTNCLSVFGHFVNLLLKGLTFSNDCKKIDIQLKSPLYLHNDKNVISNIAAKTIILKSSGYGSFKNDVTTDSKGRRLTKMVTKKDKGGRAFSIW